MSRSGRLADVAEVLRLPHYGPFLAMRVGAAVGVWMERLATGWLAWEMTQSTAWLGVVAFLRLVPALFFGLLGGAWSDRATPRHVLLWGKAGLAAANLATVALLLLGLLSIWALAALALAVGILQAVSNPAASAIVWDLVPRRHLGTAISINSLSFHTATFVGPALAAALAATAGFAPVYAVAAAGQAGLIWALLRLPRRRPSAPPTPRAASLWDDMRAGIRYVRATPPVFAILAVHLTFAVSAHPLVDMVPAVAALFFDGGTAAVGTMTAAMGAGAVIGGLWLAAFSPRGALKTVVGAALLALMALIVVLAANRSLPLALALMGCIGVCQVIRASGLQTLLQLTVRDDMRGRAMGFYSLLVRGGSAFGALGIGVASEVVGLSVALATGATLGAVALVVFALRHRDDLARIKAV
ncbi:MFS transporter [Rhodobacteraceae bacterium CCMM004]|nr:MFS transporter [Rhodobacteraceae bacterium CCMM004]